MRVGSALPATTVEIRFPEATGRAGLTFRTGQIFNAIARLGPEGLILDLGKHRLPARTQLPVQDGDLLRLQVGETAARLTLRLIRHDGPAPALEQGLREALPRQGSARELAAALESVRQARARGLISLPEGSARAVDRLLAILPAPADLRSAAAVREHLHHAGLLLESHLRKNRADAGRILDRDLKAALLRVAARLRVDFPPPGPAYGPASARPQNGAAAGEDAPKALVERLLRQTEGMLARLQVLQVRAAGAEGPGTDFGFEIPVREDDALHALHVRFQRDATVADVPEAPVTVDIRFELQREGRVHVRLRAQEAALSAAWWIEDAAFARAVAEALPRLEVRLTEAGYQVTALTCAHGVPDDDDDAPAAWRQRGLFSERV